MNVEKHKQKVVSKLDKLGKGTQMWFIKKSIKGMNQNQLEGVIGICLANNKPDEQETKKEIMNAIKEIYEKRKYEWIYD